MRAHSLQEVWFGAVRSPGLKKAIVHALRHRVNCFRIARLCTDASESAGIDVLQ